MDCTEFIRETVASLDENLYYGLRDALVDEYIPFIMMEKEDISCGVLSEKLCDYFEIIGLKAGKTFSKALEKYMLDMAVLVGDRIASVPKTKKNEPSPSVPRARKYYEKARSCNKFDKTTIQDLLDYSRLMMCLYTGILHNGGAAISDFDLSTECLSLTQIMDSMKTELANTARKAKLSVNDPYNPDRSTFILTIIMFYYIRSKEIIGEYRHV